MYLIGPFLEYVTTFSTAMFKTLHNALRNYNNITHFFGGVNRDLYYNDPAAYSNQGTLDKIVDDVSCMLKVPRNSLHVLATSKGCIAGNLSYIEVDGRFIDCTSAKSGILIPAHVEDIQSILLPDSSAWSSMQTGAVAGWIKAVAFEAKRLSNQEVQGFIPGWVIVRERVPRCTYKVNGEETMGFLHIPILVFLFVHVDFIAGRGTRCTYKVNGERLWDSLPFHLSFMSVNVDSYCRGKGYPDVHKRFNGEETMGFFTHILVSMLFMLILLQGKGYRCTYRLMVKRLWDSLHILKSMSVHVDSYCRGRGYPDVHTRLMGKGYQDVHIRLMVKRLWDSLHILKSMSVHVDSYCRGRGYPDVHTRLMVKRLWDSFTHSNLSLLFLFMLIFIAGYPDVHTRLMVKRLWDSLHIPILGLMDADPHGLDILCVYKFGSKAMSHDSPNLTVPAIKWLGVLPSDVKRLRVPEEVLLPLEKSDLNKAKDMLNRPYWQSVPLWMKEMQIILETGKKAEIQCLTAVAEDFLTDVYLPSKIKCGGWI
ncbi:putative meiotic recombination protein SPO11-like [Apostichopus japonicus]|uniref:DNA topoisomerase (ATP-hydrolyzing) n=1 Tax=Stichopus japonicus TaxID=307972 RepID=A0A2G8KC07_STIJA|nr:putative meiotic recombination protein SPO11-like [Apostichopus japonicus]